MIGLDPGATDPAFHRLGMTLEDVTVADLVRRW